MELGMPVILNS